MSVVMAATSSASLGAEAASGAGPEAASVRLDADHGGGRDVPEHFTGFSIEWTLVDRYMGPNARPAFLNLLGNLGTGVVRIGGSSQDQVPFDASAPDSDRFITPHDLALVRDTLASAPGWYTELGTTLAPPNEEYPWRGLAMAKAFVDQGVEPTFTSTESRRRVAGIVVGNEPDLSFHDDVDEYLRWFADYTKADVGNGFGRLAPSLSEPIAPWQAVRDGTADTKLFHEWPRIVESIAPSLKEDAGPLGAYVTDHFYPMARTCETDPYRCPSIERLLSAERTQNFNYQVYAHAASAAERGLPYRLDEAGTAAGRGADGVSNVAASAIWTLDAMFNAACPQPPDQPGANRDCAVGASGLHLHNAEVRAYFFPEEGNAYYNPVRYDTSPAKGAPTAAPSYYAMLVFGQLAQGARALRPAGVEPADLPVSAWQVSTRHGERRLFLMNKGSGPVSFSAAVPGRRAELSRMSPFDPTGAGRTLDAPEVRVDGRSVAADGRFPGFAPSPVPVKSGRVSVELGAGEAVVLTAKRH